jgi:hypothetical protein
MTKTLRAVFLTGDCAAGALTGVATTLAVRTIVARDCDMVAAMMLGMLAGTVVHLIVGTALSPLLGMFESMVPGMFIGMYGGMLFAMRDCMQDVPRGTALWIGAIFGIVVVLGVDFWNAQLRRQTPAPAMPQGGEAYPLPAGE